MGDKAIELLRRELQMAHSDMWKHPENRASVMPMHSVDRFEDCPDCAEREAVKFLVAHDAAPQDVSALVEALERIAGFIDITPNLRAEAYKVIRSIAQEGIAAYRQQQPAQETGR